MSSGPKRVATSASLLCILLSVLAFVATAVYLFAFMSSTMTSLDGIIQTEHAENQSVLLTRFAMARLAFNACGLFLGMAIAMLGVGLLLAGIRESMDLEATNDNARINISRLSPGGFAILCATVVIVASVFYRPTLSFGPGWNGEVQTPVAFPGTPFGGGEATSPAE